VNAHPGEAAVSGDEDFATVVGVNVTAYFARTQLVVGQMLGRARGHSVRSSTDAVRAA
jgi:hypothetical protein